MAISYNWDVSHCRHYTQHYDRTTQTLSITCIGESNWLQTMLRYDADGNPYTASVYGTQVLDTSDLSGFIDFDSVTSAEVQGWVEAAMGEEQVQTYKDNLDAQIALIITPTSVTKTLTT
jgi:hypothetical protein